MRETETEAGTETESLLSSCGELRAAVLRAVAPQCRLACRQPVDAEQLDIIIGSHVRPVRLERKAFYPIEVRDREVEQLKCGSGGDVVRVSRVSRGHYLDPHVYVALEK